MEFEEAMAVPVLAAYAWRDNAHLIRDVVVPMGYLRKEWETLDVTYGKGAFWRLWQPDVLEAHDLATTGMDFTNLPKEWKRRWKVTVLDGPYKLNGTSTPSVDARYGVEEYASPKERIQLIYDGMMNCAYVTAPGGYMLVKCQDQVCGGKVHWQTRIFGSFNVFGFELVDRFDMLRQPRPQPPRTRKDGKPSTQQHAARNYSTLLVLRRPK